MVNGNHNGHNEPIIRLQQMVKTYQTAAGPFTVLKGLNGVLPRRVHRRHRQIGQWQIYPHQHDHRH